MDFDTDSSDFSSKDYAGAYSDLDDGFLDPLIGSTIPPSSSPPSSSPGLVTPPNACLHSDISPLVPIGDRSSLGRNPETISAGGRISLEQACSPRSEHEFSDTRSFYTNSCPSSKRSKSESIDEEEYWSDDCSPGRTFSASLETRAAQIFFSDQLDTLLQQVLDERRVSNSAQYSPCSNASLDNLRTAVSSAVGSDSPPCRSGVCTASASSMATASTETPSSLGSVAQVLLSLLADQESGSSGSTNTPRAEHLKPSGSSAVSFLHPSATRLPSEPSGLKTPIGSLHQLIPDAPRKAQHGLDLSRGIDTPVKQGSESFGGTDAKQIEKMLQPNTVATPVNTLSPTSLEESPAKRRKIINSRIFRANSTEHGAPCAPSAGRLTSPRLLSMPASLRKAASLRSESSIKFEDSICLAVPLNLIETIEPSDDSNCAVSVEKRSSVSLSPSRLPPTQPVTPVQRSTEPAVLSKESEIPLLPVIAPPFVSIRVPQNLQEVAECRLSIMQAKEKRMRLSDGLDNSTATDLLVSGAAPTAGSFRMDLDEERLWRAVDSIEDDPMDDRDSEHSANSQSGEPARHGIDTIIPELNVCIDLDDDFLKEIIIWIVDVFPRSTKKSKSRAHLREQLSQSSDTRWHAAQLFIRYFIRIGSSSGSADDEDGFQALTWDIAVACLAISVKFHRDVLYPLFPVFAKEFIALAPHEMGYDDLESAQRDVFSALSYCVGSVTPQAYMDELWQTLPSLGTLLDFQGAWDVVKRDAWETLMDSLLELDHLRFPVSLLTACALVEGIINTLVFKQKVYTASSLVTRTEKWRARKACKCDCAELRKIASRSVRGVEKDMQELLRVNEASWVVCQKWIRDLV